MIESDICIIGAGPVGLFAVFEAGLLKMRCHVIDALPQVGGQLSEVYPHKPIYDIPGYPEIKGLELIDKLIQQIKPFSPGFTLGERVNRISQLHDKRFEITSSEGTVIHSKVIAIAGGLGCFEPRKPALAGLERFEGKGVSYMVRNPSVFEGKKVMIAGGGDAALDWTLYLADVAERVTLVHRGDTFRGLPDSASRIFELASNNRITLLLRSHLTGLSGENFLTHVGITDHNQNVRQLATDHLIPLFGLSPKLGPIADWGLGIDQNAIKVNTLDYSTNRERIYAIGDINTYPGKLKLILSGFHEAALMVQSAFKYIYPDEKLSFKYTTVYGVNTF
ncbi:NAD(P)/FAD-dependent oxidoreductase [Mucilaginibacter sp.]|uniref:NAD(P)/FAD-dependent oxidoreductase n=1 Tax=Mucilaginibacter sp. TaxID=1882438 RepID=UPI0035BC9163